MANANATIKSILLINNELPKELETILSGAGQAHFEVFTHVKARILEYMKRMKNFHTKGRYYGGNFPKIKAKKTYCKIPVENWHYLSNFNYSSKIQMCFKAEV